MLAIRLTKITATQNEVALSYPIVRGLYFLAGVLAVIIIYLHYIMLLIHVPITDYLLEKVQIYLGLTTNPVF